MKPTPFLNTWNFGDHWSQRVRGPELKSGQLCQVSKECHLILIQWVSTNRSTITILETLKINDQIYGRRSWKELILEYSYSVSSGEKMTFVFERGLICSVLTLRFKFEYLSNCCSLRSDHVHSAHRHRLSIQSSVKHCPCIQRTAPALISINLMIIYSTRGERTE